MKLRNCAAILAALVIGLTSSLTSAIEDEPNELNWDRLGGTLTSFEHFRAYAESRPDYLAKLLAQPESVSNGRSSGVPDRVESLWLAPKAFRLGAGGWTVADVAERSVLTYPSGHGGGATRAVVSVRVSGYYRLWTEYYHEQGSCASFIARVEDKRVSNLTAPMQAVVQDVEEFRFDFAEMGRKNDPLPNRVSEPTGFIWEGSPTFWLESGEYTVTVAGTIHDGPFAPRRVAAVVLSQEPLATPEGIRSKARDWSAPNFISAEPSDEAKRYAKIWARRPVLGEKNKSLVALWNEWRTAFMADLADYKVDGIEGRRMASMAAFDPASNLVGTPRQIRDEKARTRAFLNSVPKDAFMLKVEGEDFEISEGWEVQDSGDASGGRFLVAGYWDGLSRARYELEVPRAGEYTFWSRVLELPGYLSKFQLSIVDANGESDVVVFCADEEENKKSPGFRWIPRRLTLPKGRVALEISKEFGPGLTYRRYDCLVVTDRKDWEPEGQGEFPAPRSGSGLTLWESNPWRGFTRFTTPRAGEALAKDSAPIDVELAYGAVESRSLLLRNEGKVPQTIVPTIKGDDANILSWRLQAFVYSPQFGWTPHPLLEREKITIPAGETVGVWLTFDGDRESGDEQISVALGGKTARFNVKRVGDLRDAPVPYVGGWNAPYERVSCWETFKRLGLNTINDVIVPAEDAKKYGLKLFIKLNDGDVSAEHVAAVKKSFADYGYSLDDWAWSFMDEPGAGASDAWVELAKKFKEVAPDVRIWCNPGEFAGAPAESDLKMTPYVDCYCPYADHYTQRGGGNEDYWRELSGEGRKFAIRLDYTTPCFGERALGAPLDMFGPQSVSTSLGLDGWMFYALIGRYEYCNSPWDEANAYIGDQSIYLYPGAGGRTICTRAAEAIRAAVDQWRKARLEASNE